MHHLNIHSFLFCVGVTAFLIVFTILLNFIFNFFRKLVMKLPHGYEMICYMTAPGVAYHELSHATFGFILGAKITKIQFFQKKDSDGTLGYVTYYTRGPQLLQNFQEFFSSIAPIIWGFLGAYFLVKYLKPVVFNTHNIFLIILFYYFLICILLHSTLSDADMSGVKEAINVKTVLIFIFGLLAFVLFSYMFELPLLRPVYFFIRLFKSYWHNIVTAVKSIFH